MELKLGSNIPRNPEVRTYFNEHQLENFILKRRTLTPIKEKGSVEIGFDGKLQAEDQTEHQPGSSGTIFYCPKFPCQAQFLTYKGLQKHDLGGQCKITAPHETLEECIKTMYISSFGIASHENLRKNIEAGQMILHLENLADVNVSENLPKKCTKISEIFKQGFALPSPQERKSISKRVLGYLKDLFDAGRGRKKAKPANVVLQIREKFDREEWLTENQIANQFSRISAKERKGLQDRGEGLTAEEKEEEQALIEDESNHLDAVAEADVVSDWIGQVEEANIRDGGTSNEHPMMVLEHFLRLASLFSLYFFSDSACTTVLLGRMCCKRSRKLQTPFLYKRHGNFRSGFFEHSP